MLIASPNQEAYKSYPKDTKTGQESGRAQLTAGPRPSWTPGVLFSPTKSHGMSKNRRRLFLDFRIIFLPGNLGFRITFREQIDQLFHVREIPQRNPLILHLKYILPPFHGL